MGSQLFRTKSEDRLIAGTEIVLRRARPAPLLPCAVRQPLPGAGKSKLRYLDGFFTLDNVGSVRWLATGLVNYFGCSMKRSELRN